jgi:hypothetical protein
MPTVRRTHRPAIVCALACALLAAAISGPAAAGAQSRAQTGSALAQERYYSSYGAPQPSAAAAQERYYSSYGEPEPLTLRNSPAPSDETPWLPIALSAAIAVAFLAASAAQLRRLRIRRRAARVAA